MSTAKHKAYRKIIGVRTFNTTYAGQTVPCKTYIWCLLEGETSRTLKTTHVGFSTYIQGAKGISVLFNSKGLSLSKKTPLVNKTITQFLERRIQESFNNAYKSYILKFHSKGLSGRVIYFDQNRGSGMIECIKSGHQYQVYACNIVGKKTWYAETACMYLKRDEVVTFDLANMGDHLTSCVTGGQLYFDEEKWNSLDQSRLAFKCDESGQATNGLFAKE